MMKQLSDEQLNGLLSYCKDRQKHYSQKVVSIRKEQKRRIKTCRSMQVTADETLSSVKNAAQK